jgi:vanillate O-demethylase monooxygenase subunit
MTTYLRNTWYVAGFADELNAAQPLLARRLLDEPVVFFRSADGRVQALQDRCPHRFVPLSGGRLQGDSVECPYHGLRFDGSGACSLNPHGDGTIPKAARVRAYRAADRHGLLWFWPGDPAQADETLIPDYGFTLADSLPTMPLRGALPSACHYFYITDNVLDATHADFLHAGSLGAGLFSRVRPQVDDLDERSLRITWTAGGQPAPDFFAPFLRDPRAPADQWMEATWTAPSLVMLDTGATMAGEARDAGFHGKVLHIATPETASTCHYWYWGTQNVTLDEAVVEQLHRIARFAFEHQDKPTLEAQQRSTGEAEFWSLNPVLLPGDAGAVRARRKLEALIQREQQQQPLRQQAA